MLCVFEGHAVMNDVDVDGVCFEQLAFDEARYEDDDDDD
jgi:hypothetical protein